jgi:hypothetical protein
MVSTTIIVGRGESDTNRKIQYQIYFVSEVLSDSKTQYFHIMKLTYALLIAIPLFLGALNRGSHIIDSGRDTE